MASVGLVVPSWFRGKKDCREDLAAVASELGYLISKVPNRCVGVQSVSIRVRCSGHRECHGQPFGGGQHGTVFEHAFNCDLAGRSNSNEPSETVYCRSTINEKEIQLLTFAEKKMCSICVDTQDPKSTLLCAKLEAVLKAVLRVSKVFFPLPAKSGNTAATNPLLLLAQEPAVCMMLPPNYYITSYGSNFKKQCGHPLVDASLRSSFINVIQKLTAVIDDLHMEQVLMELLGTVPLSTVPTESKEELRIYDSLEVVQDVVHDEEEPGATRDEELLREQAEHDWADDVMERRLQSGTTQDVINDCEKIFLYPYSRAPEAFRQALLEGNELKAVRDRMRDEGCDFVLQPSGAKVFVRPEHYPEVLNALKSRAEKLRASNVIIAESFLPALEDSIKSIAHGEGVYAKKHAVEVVTSIEKLATASSSSDGYNASMATSGADHMSSNLLNEAEFWGYIWKVERTVLTFARAPRNSGSVNQSTTEAHGGRNPRRNPGGGLEELP